MFQYPHAVFTTVGVGSVPESEAKELSERVKKGVRDSLDKSIQDVAEVVKNTNK